MHRTALMGKENTSWSKDAWISGERREWKRNKTRLSSGDQGCRLDGQHPDCSGVFPQGPEQKKNEYHLDTWNK